MHKELQWFLEKVAKQTMLIAGDGESALSCRDEEVPTELAIEAKRLLAKEKSKSPCTCCCCKSDEAHQRLKQSSV